MNFGEYVNEFFIQLKSRNKILFYFGAFNILLALTLFAASFLIDVQYLGTHAFYKPIKFGLSIGIYSWTMAWICFYLRPRFHSNAFSWGVTVLLGFEIVYIAIQAMRAQGSHYNISSPFYGLMYVAMGVAAAAVTFWTAYVGFLFFTRRFEELPAHFLWGIRFGILIFVIFSFEGFVMGSRMSHTVGAADGSEGYFFLNWSKKFGDLRISHFLGMHALQVVPLSAHLFLKSNFRVIVFGIVYSAVTVAVLAWTLGGRPVL